MAWRTVIRVADQERTPLEARLDLPRKPFVPHIVPEDVREERADHPALRRPRFWMRDASVFEDTRVEPCADQSQQHPIPHPTLKRVAEVAVVNRIERDAFMMPRSTTRLNPSPKRSR